MSYFGATWKNWLKWFAVVLVFAIACGFLSNWQFHRRQEKLVAIERVLANFATPAQPIDSVLSGLGSWKSEDEWRAVSVVGHYLPEKAVLVRNRPNSGQPGFEQLVPFVQANSRVILVSRGWVATGNNQDSPDVNPMPSDSQRTIIVRLRPSEAHDGRTAPAGQVPNLEVARVCKQLKLSGCYSKSYGRVYSDSSDDPALQALEQPVTDEGNNLSYAIQWIVFAAMAFGALFWMIRTERDRYLGRTRTKTRKTPTDEDVEDSLS